MENTPPHSSLIKITDNRRAFKELARLINQSLDLMREVEFDTDGDSDTNCLSLAFRGEKYTGQAISESDSDEVKMTKFGVFALLVERTFFPRSKRPETIKIDHDGRNPMTLLRSNLLWIYLIGMPYRNQLAKKAICYCPECRVICEEAKNKSSNDDKRHFNALKLVFFMKTNDTRSFQDIIKDYLYDFGWLDAYKSECTLPGFREWSNEWGCQKAPNRIPAPYNRPKTPFYESVPQMRSPSPQASLDRYRVPSSRNQESMDMDDEMANTSQLHDLSEDEKNIVDYIRTNFIPPRKVIQVLKDHSYRQVIGGLHGDVPLNSLKSKETLDALSLENTSLRKHIQELTEQLHQLRRFLIK